MVGGKHANRRPNAEVALSWDCAHSIMWYMIRMISRRLGFPMILVMGSGNAASMSALVVKVCVGAIVLGSLSNADVLTLYLLVGRFLNNSQNFVSSTETY